MLEERKNKMIAQGANERDYLYVSIHDDGFLVTFNDDMSID